MNNMLISAVLGTTLRYVVFLGDILDEAYSHPPGGLT